MEPEPWDRLACILRDMVGDEEFEKALAKVRAQGFYEPDAIEFEPAIYGPIRPPLERH